MKVVVDTNIVISALLSAASVPGQILQLWLVGRFEILAHDQWLDEIRDVTRRPHIRSRIVPPTAGKLVNLFKDRAVWLAQLPDIDRSTDPFDNYVLAMAAAGNADALVTGDKSGLLLLERHGPARILTARTFLEQLAAT